MEKDYTKEHEHVRKLLWINAWSNVASSIGCNTTNIADRWADEALKSFDERFKPPHHAHHAHHANTDNGISRVAEK